MSRLLHARLSLTLLQIDSRRRSGTTISSYDELTTPRSEKDRPFQVVLKPVEGPTGPHLFRASQYSADLMHDFALLESPVAYVKAPTQTETAFSHETVTPRHLVTSSDTDSIPTCRPVEDVQHWTPQQVTVWMSALGIEHAIIERFEAHDIDGAILMDLQFDNLKELDIPSFGKRHHLWSTICKLKGGESGPSPVPTPFQDISRPCTNLRSKSDGDVPRSACPDTPIDNAAEPISAGPSKKRRGRKHRHHNDPITPAESISIVAIEQLMPKPHTCAKGEKCPKWRKQQRLASRIREENGYPISPMNGGHIIITGNPGNAATTDNMLPRAQQQEDYYRSPSEAVPSVVASSDVLGPGQLPEFALHEDMLQQLESRDPQENVKQFLSLQHIDAPTTELPPTPPLEMFPVEHHQSFPRTQQSPPPAFQAPRPAPAPHSNLKALPKLSIPPSTSASPHLARQHNGSRSAGATLSPTGPSRCATASPSTGYRYGTPASEMDIPMTSIMNGPISRDTSQSVPPNMHFRDLLLPPRPSISRNDWRRPSFDLPVLNEGEIFSPVTSALSPCRRAATFPPTSDTSASIPTGLGYGADVTHAGWMKKRKTKLLRHEWQDAHIRLRGTQLAVHANSRLSAATLQTIDVDDYTVACSSSAGNSKISAALKSLKLSSASALSMGEKKGADATAFAFQLIPACEKDVRARVVGAGKTHHFAVKSVDERIDWMRDLMLAKALRQKDAGFSVEVNGRQA